MKKTILFALIFISSLNLNFAHPGDSTCTENCKEAVMSDLIGEWSFLKFSFSIVDNVHACEQLIVADDAFVKFQFDDNGTYVKTFGIGDEATLETGNWELRGDLQNLILFPNDDSATEIIKIKKMENEKIVLEMDIQELGLEELFCTKINVLDFGKNILPLKSTVIK